jgi:asparagine synthase (glutamine-hydrolysing)
MCGIVGTFNYRAAEGQILHCHESIRYRGPDGFGVYQEDSIFLAHRRLAIIDLQSGQQPIYNENQSIVVVINPEVFNYVEIRKELQERDHVFTTESDFCSALWMLVLLQKCEKRND